MTQIRDAPRDPRLYFKRQYRRVKLSIYSYTFLGLGPTSPEATDSTTRPSDCARGTLSESETTTCTYRAIGTARMYSRNDGCRAASEFPTHPGQPLPRPRPARIDLREHAHSLPARTALRQPRRRQQLPSSSMPTASSISHATGLPKAGTNMGAQGAGSQGARGAAVQAATHRLELSSTVPQRTQLHSLSMRRTVEFRP